MSSKNYELQVTENDITRLSVFNLRNMGKVPSTCNIPPFSPIWFNLSFQYRLMHLE